MNIEMVLAITARVFGNITTKKFAGVAEAENVTQEQTALNRIYTFVNTNWAPTIVFNPCSPENRIKITLLSSNNKSYVDAMNDDIIDADPLVNAIAEYTQLVNSQNEIKAHIIASMGVCISELTDFSLHEYIGERFDSETMYRISAHLKYAIEMYNDTHEISLMQLFINKLLMYGGGETNR